MASLLPQKRIDHLNAKVHLPGIEVLLSIIETLAAGVTLTIAQDGGCFGKMGLHRGLVAGFLFSFHPPDVFLKGP